MEKLFVAIRENGDYFSGFIKFGARVSLSWNPDRAAFFKQADKDTFETEYAKLEDQVITFKEVELKNV